MKGSAKQIAWAEEIQGRVVGIIDNVLSDCEERKNNVPADQYKNAVTMWTNLKNACLDCEYASAIINCYSNVKNWQGIVSATRIHHANTPAEKALLCK